MSIFTAKVKSIIAEAIRKNEELINPEDSLYEHLGLNSLDLVELVVDLEKEYNIHIPNESAEKFKTVKDITDFLDTNITNG